MTFITILSLIIRYVWKNYLMFQTILRNWNFIRLIRLVFGVALLLQSFYEKSAFAGFLGGLFVFQSLTNTGCCGSGSCSIPVTKKNDDVDDIEYQEIK